MLYPVMLLVGVGIGTGVGMLISKPRIDEKKKEIDLLVTQMQTAKTDSDKTIQLHKSELMRMKNMLMQTTTKLANINAELKEIENRTSESPATSEPEVVITTPSDTNRTPSTVPTIDYTVQDGDSFWKIAQEQLGDGNRYTEILKLNPTISENQTLTIGTKIKIPTR